MNKELIKQEIASFGYNRYVQNVVCDYFLSNGRNRNEDIRSYQFFNDLKCKLEIERNVLPHLISNKEKFNK